MQKIKRIEVDLSQAGCDDLLRDYKKNLFERSCLESVVHALIANPDISNDRIKLMTDRMLESSYAAETAFQQILYRNLPAVITEPVHASINTLDNKLIVCGKVKEVAQ